LDTIPLAALSRDMLVDVFEIYFKNAYQNELRRREEIRAHLSKTDIDPEHIKEQFKSYHSLEWRLGNFQWEHMKLWMHYDISKEGVYFEVQTNDHGEPKFTKDKNKEIAVAIRRGWLEKGIPCDKRGL